MKSGTLFERVIWKGLKLNRTFHLGVGGQGGCPSAGVDEGHGDGLVDAMLVHVTSGQDLQWLLTFKDH